MSHSETLFKHTNYDADVSTYAASGSNLANTVTYFMLTATVNPAVYFLHAL